MIFSVQNGPLSDLPRPYTVALNRCGMKNEAADGFFQRSHSFQRTQWFLKLPQFQPNCKPNSNLPVLE